MSLTVEPESDESMLLGKAAAELQSNIVIEEDEIVGTLNYVTGYTGFSNVTADQEGNYLALKVSTVPENGVTTTVELVGGTKGPVTLDDDRNIVLRITNKDTQSIKVVATKDKQSITKTYGLTGLTLASSES